MAEGLARKVLARDGIEMAVRSAGTAAESSVTREAVEAMRKYDIDIGKHVPEQMTPGLVRDALVVLCMTNDLKAEVVRRAPIAKGKVFTLPEFVHDRGGDDLTRGVADPIGGGPAAYEYTADQLARLIEQLPSPLRGWPMRERAWCYFRCLVHGCYRG